MTEAEQNALIIEHMDDLVPAIAAEFRGRDLEYDDILSAGRVGLVKAARCFDPARGTKFANWAMDRIRGEIHSAVRSAEAKWYPKEADITHLPAGGDSIEKIYEWDCWGEFGNAISIYESWAALDASPEELSILHEDIREKRSKFRAAFISLTVAQRKLVTWVYLANPAMPITQASRELGVSYFQTIRMLKKALKTMRRVIDRMESKTISEGDAKGHPSLSLNATTTGRHGRTLGSIAAYS